NPEVFADEREPSPYTSADAQRFMHEMTQQLGLSTDTVLPGYEDTWYYLWRERRLPVNVDPFDAKLDDEMERNRLRRIYSQGLAHPVGYVLPLQAVDTGNLAVSAWETGRWFLREERMYLMPGDSPMGWRLPLDSLPWSAPTDRLHMIEQDPFSPHLAARTPLPTVPINLQSRHSRQAFAPAPVKRFESDPAVVRTALCVEVRDPTRANGPKAEAAAVKNGKPSGVLYVFMPPLARLEDYLALVSAVEATALKLGLKVIMEGYPPPRDPRLKLLQLTPDPGVIEVNIHPAHNWTELVEHTEFLYQAAFETRLSAEKFMSDGRHTGTGGGNHMVMGGATPADSPFLRRPELLASMVLYWHNRPSLSYLFSGMFIGPTSQAPRVDEARNDQVYELEIALREIVRHRQKHGQDMPPWTVDRTLRNILIDVTGNTHRSEFCIDKMYSP
uniref:transglutaminase family protein n=1 Tax=Limnohabitans sp. TaxID=1907725 RepID=UPI0040477D7D